MSVPQILSKEETGKYVPHAGKMFLLSRVVYHSIPEKKLISEVDVSTADLFYDEELHGVPVWVGFEYMAQSVSALSGIHNSELGISPKVGFIVSVTNFESFTACYKPGTTVSIEVIEAMRVEMAVTFNCKVCEKNGEMLLKGVLNAVEVDSLDKVL